MIVGDEVSGTAVGLAHHGESCTCSLRPREVGIDYHDPPQEGDAIGFCPATIPGIQAFAVRVIRQTHIHEYGLDRFYGVDGICELPHATVAFDEEVEAARHRLEREMLDAARRK